MGMPYGHSVKLAYGIYDDNGSFSIGTCLKLGRGMAEMMAVCTNPAAWKLFIQYPQRRQGLS
jgi:hypothetical protein